MKVFIPGNPIQNGPISRQEYIQLLEAVRAMARAMDVQTQGGVSASWGPGGLAISSSTGSRSTQEAAQYASHPFKVTTYTSSGSVVIGVAAGVVNNALQIAKTQLSYTSPMYPAVAVVFTINADGTVVPSSASLVTNKDPSTDPHIVISGSSVTVYCFLAKVETVSGASAVQQWLTGNFFVSPLGYQKQLWYA